MASESLIRMKEIDIKREGIHERAFQANGMSLEGFPREIREETPKGSLFRRRK